MRPDEMSFLGCPTSVVRGERGTLAVAAIHCKLNGGSSIKVTGRAGVEFPLVFDSRAMMQSLLDCWPRPLLDVAVTLERVV